MKKTLLSFLFGALAIGTSYGQDCNTNPSQFSDYAVSGQFAVMGSGDDEFNDVVMVRQVGSYIHIDVLKGDAYGNRTLKKSVSTFYYDLSNVDGRIVAGDFNHDGWHNEFALIYKSASSTMKVDVFTSNLSSNPTFTKSTYLTLSGYDPDKTTGRVVSGDFDRDNRWDDIALFYDYGGGQTRIHVLKSTGSSFSYGGSYGMWNTYGYTAGQITNRVVSGDFDRDGKEDDIAAFYDYGGGQTRIHVWLSNGSTFNYQGGYGWWSATGYTASKITGRVVSVNIDRDGKIFDDIAVFYDYGNGHTKMHVFESTGSGFNYSWWWTASSGYYAGQITDKVVAIDTRAGLNGGKISDVLALYDYGTTTTKYHIWKAYNPLFGSPYVSYSHHNFCNTKSAESEQPVVMETGELDIRLFPNPAQNEATLQVSGVENGTAVTVEVYNSVGALLTVQEFTTDIKRDCTLDLSDWKDGMYFVKTTVNGTQEVQKLVKR